MYQANGWKFIDEFFIQHHFQRYTSNKYKHLAAVLFFPLGFASDDDSVAAVFLRGDLETDKNSDCKIQKSRNGKTRNSQLATRNFRVGVAARAARFLFGFRLETSRLYFARSARRFDFDGAICL